MSEESRYYKIGKERAREGKSTPLGMFSFANAKERRAAQRGWEAGQSANEHADAFQDALRAWAEKDETNLSNSPSSSSEVFGFLFLVGLCGFIAIICGFFAWIFGANLLIAAGSQHGPVDSWAIYAFSTIFGVAAFAFVLYKFFPDLRSASKGLARHFGAVLTNIAYVILIIIGVGILLQILGLLAANVFPAK